MTLEKLTGTLANEILDEMRYKAFSANGTEMDNAVYLSDVKNILQHFMNRGNDEKRKVAKEENVEYQLTDQTSGRYVHLTLSPSAAHLLEWLYDNDYLQDDIHIVDTDACTAETFTD